ncbi:MAG: hypothetical protein GY899_15610 [Verrucomicrobiaceae bacterium]|nr:hypothetical protein [Verrucomicrobiaceae bacterium]
MLKGLLGLDPTETVSGFDLHLRGGWLLALPLILGAIIFTIYLYRSEVRLPRRRRLIMSACQLLALLTLILIVLEPVADVKVSRSYKRDMLVLLDTSNSMATKDKLTRAEDIKEVASLLGKLPATEGQDTEKPLGNAETEALRKEIGDPTRLELARAALTQSKASNLVLEELKKDYNLSFFAFDGSLQSEGGEEGLEETIKALTADGESTQVGSAIDAALGRFAGKEIAGMVVVSDFISVEGKDPVEVTRSLKGRNIPIYTVPIGLPSPPDIHVRKIIAPEVVFKGDRVLLRVQIESQGFSGEAIELALNIEGKNPITQQVELQDGVQFADLTFTPDDSASGTVKLDVATPIRSGEASDTNNSTTHKVRILEEKIKVLYIEGMPRWEFRYLRQVLLRDPRLDVQFYMTQGDPTLAQTSHQHIGRFPQNKETAFGYDLIIIGDVPAGKFTTDEIKLIEELVKERGGSLLMLAGPVAAPTSYKDTPIADILPVKIGTGNWEAVSGNYRPVVTPAGRESQATSLALSDETTDRIWSNVKRMGILPPLDGAKPGATVLLTHSGKAEGFDQYPLVSWQRFGSGKSLFVATEDLWRMRLEVGDRHHARFWAQTIQFLTLSRLLGQNKQITLETNRATFSAGDTVQIYANVLDLSFDPVNDPDGYTVILERKGATDSASEITLQPVDADNSPGIYSAAHIAGEDATYVIKTRSNDETRSNSTEFEVATVPPETRETGARPDIAEQIAELSGGKSISPSGLGGLPEELGEESAQQRIKHIERDLWDIPLWFLLILLFAGIEWFLRRRENLI